MTARRTPPERRVVRDASWIEREYGRDKWPGVLEKINAYKEMGERSLSRVVEAVMRWELGQPLLQPVAARVLGEEASLPAAVAWHGLYALVCETVIAASRNDTAAIVDLGCGWGRSLFQIWLRGGPRATRYHGLDFTQAGLDCVGALASLEPGIDIRTARFDFNDPDFSGLAPPIAHAVVFTVSSLHQIPAIDRDAYRAVLGVADKIDCLHFEQLGWQIEKRDRSSADRSYAERHDYNRNLWSVLSEMAEAGEIEFAAVYPDLLGPDAVYPLSLVHWRRG